MTTTRQGSAPRRSRLHNALLSGVLAVLPAALLAAGSAHAAAPGAIYVSGEGAGVVAAVAPDTLRVERRITVGDRPHNMLRTADGLLLVATQGSDAVTVIAPGADPARVRRVEIGVPPHDLALAADGTAWVVSGRGDLVRFDPATGRVGRRVALPGSPHNVMALDGAAWVTDVAARRLWVVAPGADPRAVPLSIVGHDLALRPGTRELWVTAWDDTRMVAIDPASGRELASLAVGRSPSHKHLAFTPDGREAWVSEHASGHIFVVDAVARRVVDAIDAGGHPHHVRLAGGRAYAAVTPHLVVLDVATRRVLRRVRIGAEVHDVTLFPGAP